MPSAARKTADAAPADAEPSVEVAATEAPLAEEAPAEPEAAPADFRPPVTVVFAGQAQSHVAGVGLCEPDEEKTVPAALADALCAGDTPAFRRASA